MNLVLEKPYSPDTEHLPSRDPTKSDPRESARLDGIP